MLLKPRFWGAHLLMVLAVAAAVALGIWQYDVWGAARDAKVHDLTDAKATPLASVMGGDDPFPGRDLGRPVTLSGTWMSGDTVYVSGREERGQQGFWVVTPVLVGGSAMPVVRGWSAAPEAPPARGPVEVTGWLQPTEDSGRPDAQPADDVLPELRIASLVAHVDADLYSGFVVAREASSGTTGLAGVRPEAVPDVSSLTSLRNLLYAFQWWIFGGFAIYVWQRWCRDVLEETSAPAEPVAAR